MKFPSQIITVVELEGFSLLSDVRRLSVLHCYRVCLLVTDSLSMEVAGCNITEFFAYHHQSRDCGLKKIVKTAIDRPQPCAPEPQTLFP